MKNCTTCPPWASCAGCWTTAWVPSCICKYFFFELIIFKAFFYKYSIKRSLKKGICMKFYDLLTRSKLCWLLNNCLGAIQLFWINYLKDIFLKNYNIKKVCAWKSRLCFFKINYIPIMPRKWASTKSNFNYLYIIIFTQKIWTFLNFHFFIVRQVCNHYIVMKWYWSRI